MVPYRRFLANPWWSWHTTFHKRVQEHSAGATVQFFRAGLCSPLSLSCCAGCFQTQWVHLSGQAQCEKKVSKALSVSVKGKKNEKKGVRKNDHCLVSKNVKTGLFDSGKNRPLIEMSARDKCSCPQYKLLKWSQLDRFYPCWRTCS